MQSDEQLWQLSVEGDRDAFGQIVERYQSLICSLAYSACGDLARSEDLAQETFVAAWRNLDELREPTKLRAWLCGIARNLAHSTVRREHRRGDPEPLELAAEQVSTGADPSRHAVTQEEADLLWRALEGMQESYREPLVLFYREQQSIAQVSAGLGLSEDVVKQRLSRGRALLRAEMTSLVERTLTRTRPGSGFSLGVLAALSPISPRTAGAVAGAVAGKGATAAAKSALSALGLGALLGSGIGLLSGWLSTKAVEMTAISEPERICLRRHCLSMVLSAFALCALLILTLSQAGKMFPVTTTGLVFGIFVWVGVLVATILLINSRMQRRVRQIRKSMEEQSNGRIVR